MRIVEVTYGKPANLLIGSLQNYCQELMRMPENNGICRLKDLEDKIWLYAEMQKSKFPKCRIDKLEVISHANVIHEWYNLLYNGEKSMISVFARPDITERAFMEYDNMRIN